MARHIQRAFAAVGLLAFVACLIACGGGSGTEVKKLPAPQSIESDDELADAIWQFETDWKAAKPKYKGTMFTAEGHLLSAKWYSIKSEGLSVVLSKVRGRHIVVASFSKDHEKSVLALEKGQTVKLKGRLTHGHFEQGVVTLSLDDSVLVK